MEKIVVLNSGGFDSIVLIHYLYNIIGIKNLYSLHFLYGANNERQQLECVNKVCKKFGINNKIIELPKMDWTNSNFFTDKEYETDMQYLEWRNLIFLSYALSYAESIKADTISLALIGNYEYKDCTPYFIDGFNNISVISNVDIYTPFIGDSKDRLAHISKYLNIKGDEYFSCDKPLNNKPCGICKDCITLKEIFKNIQ